MNSVRDCIEDLEEESARRLLHRQLEPWLQDVKPLLARLHRHADPDVKGAAGELHRHIARLVLGK